MNINSSTSARVFNSFSKCLGLLFLSFGIVGCVGRVPSVEGPSSEHICRFNLNQEGFPILDCFCGEEPVTALFDTGATGTSIRNSSKCASKAELTCRHYRIKNAKDEVFIGEECVIPKLKIDDMVFEGLIGCISENTVATESEKWLDTNDLVLGRDLYDNKLILIDYEDQKLVFGDSLTELEEMGYDFKKWNCTKMEYNNFGIHLVVTSHLANGQESPLVFKLDTGTNANALKVNLVCDEDEKEELLYQNIELPGLLLGNKSFNPGSFYLFDLNFGDEVHGILGYPFFEKHVVLLDFPNRAVYLKEL